MAEGGTSPVGDPGNLSIYNLHGGTNKMVELVSDVTGSMDMLPLQSDGNQALFQGQGQSSMYPVQSDMVPGGYNVIQIDQLNYGDGASYDDLKRSSSIPNYYNSSETIQNPDNIPVFSNHTLGNYQQNQQEILKTNTDSMGYIQLLSNTESLGQELGIKKEKLDYTEVMNSQSPDIPYPPNTCISDWNFYNSSMGLHSNPELGNQSNQNFNVFQVPSMQHQQPYMHGPPYENNPHMPPISVGMSNEDIHNHARKISHEIMNSGWNSESLYKSQLYSNVGGDAINRKRRTESEKPGRPVKSRRRRSDNMEGHSKTVASILLSDNHLPSSSKTGNGTRSWPHNDVLDSTERNVLLSSLMDNLRSTVQYESFCLSFPRPIEKENAFRRKVIHAINMINDIPGLSIKSNPIPPDDLNRATKIISSFKSALLNTEGGGRGQTVKCDKFHNLRSDQVEEHLPHSMLWAVKIDDHLLTANWEGQFVATVNPAQGTLSVSIFQFQPCFSPDGIRCLQTSKLTKTLADEIIENMRQFEVSRQLRFDVSLQSITQIFMFVSAVDRDSGFLVFEVSESPKFYQRWIHCSAENKNKWKKRKSFFKYGNTRSCKFVCVAGLFSELSELVSLVLASNSDVEKLYERGTIKPLKMDLADLYTYENGFDNFENTGEITAEIESFNGFETHTNRLGKNCLLLKNDIVKVLLQNNIVKDAKSVKIRGEIEANGSEIHDVNKDYCKNLGIQLDDNISECFTDYINYTCNSATELGQLLALKVNPSLYGFCDTDFDLALVPGGNIEELTVGQLISSKCSKVVYFSFCNRQVGQLGHEKHCSKCRSCNTWQYWHCNTCNKCTDSRQLCEYCGHLRDDPLRCVIKPLSVYKSQEDSGKLVLEAERNEWILSLNLPSDDLVFWEFPKLLQMDNSNSVMQYNSHNAMIDQLGLLNPVGFLLGQPASVGGRKHRRNKDSGFLSRQTENHSKNTKSGSGSTCNLQ